MANPQKAVEGIHCRYCGEKVVAGRKWVECSCSRTAIQDGKVYEQHPHRSWTVEPNVVLENLDVPDAGSVVRNLEPGQTGGDSP